MLAGAVGAPPNPPPTPLVRLGAARVAPLELMATESGSRSFLGSEQRKTVRGEGKGPPGWAGGLRRRLSGCSRSRGAPGFGVLLVVVERGWRAKGQQGAEPWCLQDAMRSPEPALGAGARHW